MAPRHRPDTDEREAGASTICGIEIAAAGAGGHGDATRVRASRAPAKHVGALATPPTDLRVQRVTGRNAVSADRGADLDLLQLAVTNACLFLIPTNLVFLAMQANALEMSRQAEKAKAKRAHLVQTHRRQLQLNAVLVLRKRMATYASKAILKAFWAWKHNSEMGAAYVARIRAERSRRKREREAVAKHKRGALQLLGRWASSRRSSDLSTSFLLWKHSTNMWAMATARNREKIRRSTQIASRAFRCAVYRLWKNNLERAWDKWIAFSAHWMSIQQLRSLFQNKIVLLKRKWVHVSNGKMQRNMKKLKRKMTRRNTRGLKLQSLLLRLICSKGHTFRVYKLHRCFRRWQLQSQLDTLELRNYSLERSETVLSVMVSRLRDGMRCQQVLASWRGFTLTQKLRKHDVLKTRLLLQMEDEKSVLSTQLSTMENRLDEAQYRLIDRQAEYASNSREADIRRAVSILGSLLLCRAR